MLTLTRVSDVCRRSSIRGEGLFVYTDVSSSDDVKRLFEEAHHFQGGIDVLVNNAGIGHGPLSERHFLKTDYGMWENLMNIHINGLYHCSQMAAKVMVHQGEGGVIINMSSGGATRAHRNRVAYDATKGAIEVATRAMALDLAPWKIRVNAVMPGAIWVENRTAVGEESSPDHLIPLGRLGMPQDVGQGVRFLASPEASYITGHVLAIDGGLTAQPSGAKYGCGCCTAYRRDRIRCGFNWHQRINACPYETQHASVEDS